MKIEMKTSKLIGDQLDWAVAKCLGYQAHLCPSKILVIGESIEAWETWEPSTNWSQGGPIIEREKIDLQQKFEGPEGSFATSVRWQAKRHTYGGPINPPAFTAQTPLIAAMRCYVASKLGNEIDIPEELL